MKTEQSHTRPRATVGAPRKRVFKVFGLLIAAVVAWWLLGLLEPRAGWLHVDGPSEAAAGGTVRLHVDVTPRPEAVWLCADLHWGATREHSQSYLATGGVVMVGTNGGSFDFQISVPPRSGMRFVNGVLYLTRTGGWEGRTRAAATESIPVREGPGTRSESQLNPLRVFSLPWTEAPLEKQGVFPRILTALILVSAALTVWRRSRAPAGVCGGKGSLWGGRWLASAAALAGLWEGLGLEIWLGAHARGWAHWEHIYHLRGWFQKATISLVFVAIAVFWVCVARIPGPRRRTLVMFGLYAALAGVSMVSWHVFDQVADATWHGVSLIQALKMACATCFWVGALLEARRSSENA